MATIKGHGPSRGAFRGARDGAKIWWVAPNYPIANELIWPDLKKALNGAWLSKRESEHYIELPGGGSISVKSADKPDSLRGSGLDGIVFDEAAFAKKVVWTEVLRPMLADRQGWAMFLTTPNGCNWFYEMFRDAHGDSEWERWQKPTRENPLINELELEKARLKQGPRAFAQEFEAKFSEEEGALFPVEYFPDSIWFDEYEWPHRSDIALKVIACDPSMGKTDLSDYSAIVMLALTNAGEMYVKADLERRPPAKIVADALRHYRDFGADGIGWETITFQELLQRDFESAAAAVRCEVNSYGITHHSGGKTNRVLGLDKYLVAHPATGRGCLHFLRGDRGTELLVEQLRGFPLKSYHDDGPDALEMAIRLADKMISGELNNRHDYTHVYA